MDALGQVIDLPLIATVGLIFAVTLIGAYLRSSRRDQCLKAFEGYHVTLERGERQGRLGRVGVGIDRA